LAITARGEVPALFAEADMNATDIKWPTDYRIIRKLASGGMGEVYLAEQLGAESFRKTVAIKFIKKEFLSDKRSLGLFLGEAKLTDEGIRVMKED